MEDDVENITWQTVRQETNLLRGYRTLMSLWLPKGQRLEEKHLITAANIWKLIISDDNEVDETINLEILVAGVAIPVLISFLGIEWVQRNTLYGVSRLRDLKKMSRIMKPLMKDKSLDLSDESIAQATKALINTLELAEALYNLRGCSGFDAKLRDFNGGREKTEDIFAEFQAAQILFQRGAHLQFIDASEKQGRDYDVIAFLPNQVAIACELKCNREGTNFTKQTLKNALDGAVSQLPTDIPTLIMVKVPEDFTKKRNLVEVFESFLNENFFLFSNNNRVSGVVLFRNVYELEGDKYRYFHSFVQIQNPKASIPLIDIGSFSQFPESDARWRYFDQVLGIERFGVG